MPFTVLRAPCLRVTSFSSTACACCTLDVLQGLSSPFVLQDCMGLELFALSSRPWLLLQALRPHCSCWLCFCQARRSHVCVQFRVPAPAAGSQLQRRNALACAAWSPRWKGSVDTCTLYIEEGCVYPRALKRGFSAAFAGCLCHCALAAVASGLWRVFAILYI